MIDRLFGLATETAARAHAPYSIRPDAVAVADASGRWLAAPRVESASYPLTVPSLQGAWALAGVAGVVPAVVVGSRAPTAEEAAFVAVTWPHLRRLGDAFVAEATPEALDAEPASFSGQGDLDTAAVAVAARAVVPASDFRVGAAVRDADGRTVVGANVEHPEDWTRGLCAERVALVAARAAGLGRIETVSVACVSAPGGAPCGGCRQLLAEQAPGATVRIWADAEAVRETSPEALLPDAFVGDSLRS